MDGEEMTSFSPVPGNHSIIGGGQDHSLVEAGDDSISACDWEGGDVVEGGSDPDAVAGDPGDRFLQ
jgi:hypothetical protein